MLLFGHIGIGAFVASMLFLPILFGIAGALLPDVIDKGLFVLGLAPCGRFVAHSLFFPPVAGILTYLVTRNKKIAIAIALGAALHLLQDMHDNVPFLAPIKTYEFYGTCGQIKILFTPYIIATELIGGVLLIFTLGFRKKLAEFRKDVWNLIYRILRR